ncbi:hypothetical protein Leryth_002054 [Lithospermum erythrorhizon]|nr:hypothetical protein Leryth_002054 [Lithospermum erythrorhizon]
MVKNKVLLMAHSLDRGGVSRGGGAVRCLLFFVVFMLVSSTSASLVKLPRFHLHNIIRRLRNKEDLLYKNIQGNV